MSDVDKAKILNLMQNLYLLWVPLMANSFLNHLTNGSQKYFKVCLLYAASQTCKHSDFFFFF